MKKEMQETAEHILLKGVRVNNLKNITVEIPRDKLVVITGVSGSGKSSLAFDTLYAEGQRRYVESLSSYARQFLGRMNKPECDYIQGIPPAIAIEQKVVSRNPRSTVGTSTEIYEYLRLLFARIGHTVSPVSGTEVKHHTAEDVVACAQAHEAGTRFMVLCPIEPHADRTLKQQLETYFHSGFSRMARTESMEEAKAGKGILHAEVILLEDYLKEFEGKEKRIEEDRGRVLLVVDRLSVSDSKDTLTRLTDSVETAFYEGHGVCKLLFMPGQEVYTFSTRFEADGITFEEPSDNLFAFNSPAGACPECEGFGKVMGIDEQLVIPNTAISVYEGAVVCWRGAKMSEWKDWFIRHNSERGFPVFTPYYELTQEQKDWLWHGTIPKSVPADLAKPNAEEKEWGRLCIDAFFDYLKEGQYKIQNRVMLARYRGKTTCPKCHGTRLRKEASYVQVDGKNITELIEMPVSELIKWAPLQEVKAEKEGIASESTSHLTDNERQVAKRILTEIYTRLQFLINVGLGYLTLNRPSNTLSGGESQRINLATSLGSSLEGSLYILDEPSIGLHSRDTDRLIQVLKQLRDTGNTVVVVEHDEEIMRAADWIIDIGPEAGRLGGNVVWQGSVPEEGHRPEDVTSHTLDYLCGTERIAVPEHRRAWNHAILVKGARAHNLKGIDVRFPLNVMTCVTGVSGSGKSSLVKEILYNAMKRQLDQVADRPGEFMALEGNIDQICEVEFIDQNPIGKSTRSNPVTYIKAWDEIRKLLAAQPLCAQMGYSAGHFSFNTDGGRCEECKGEGTVTVEMQFMADLVLECESCHGKRFKKEILEVRYKGKNVCDILDMTVNQALEFFTEHGEKRITTLLKPLQDVGLGYIRLGQSSSTLSGGENQRVKLAYYLSREKQHPTLFIFDEPTTGLHFHDIRKLMESFNALIDRGHTLVIIEHNLDVIKCADYVIDLGAEGGAEGGHLVACGTPEEICACTESYTGHFLKDKLGLQNRD